MEKESAENGLEGRVECDLAEVEGKRGTPMLEKEERSVRVEATVG